MFVHSFQRLKHRWFQWNSAALAWNPPGLLWFATQRLPFLLIQLLQLCRLLWTNARFTQTLQTNKYFSSANSAWMHFSLVIKSFDKNIWGFIFSMKVFNTGKSHFVVERACQILIFSCNPVWSGWGRGKTFPKHYHCKFCLKPSLPSLKGARSRHYQFKSGDHVICQYSIFFSIVFMCQYSIFLNLNSFYLSIIDFFSQPQ